MGKSLLLVPVIAFSSAAAEAQVEPVSRWSVFEEQWAPEPQSNYWEHTAFGHLSRPYHTSNTSAQGATAQLVAQGQVYQNPWSAWWIHYNDLHYTFDVVAPSPYRLQGLVGKAGGADPWTGAQVHLTGPGVSVIHNTQAAASVPFDVGGVLMPGRYFLFARASVRYQEVASTYSNLTLTVACYANCDLSTTVPVLNVADFACFLGRFAAGDSYANCDLSTTPPVLNVADFACFLARFAAGCS